MPLVTESPAFQVGIAFLLGMIGQVLARHLRLPGIVVLLALGVAAGRDGLDVLRPEILGHGLATLVAFAVAIILFEGGMALDLGAVRSRRTGCSAGRARSRSSSARSSSSPGRR